VPQLATTSRFGKVVECPKYLAAMHKVRRSLRSHESESERTISLGCASKRFGHHCEETQCIGSLIQPYPNGSWVP